MASLPYVTAPGNIERALNGIKSASTPERVTQDFVKTVLQIPGGSGNQMTSYLRKIGFVNKDGAPSDLYKKFRNSSTSGMAAAEALKIGYGPLYVRNEYMHQLSDDKLKGLIIEETGQSDSSSVIGFVLAGIKVLKKYADFTPQKVEPDSTQEPKGNLPVQLPQNIKRVGLNLSYTINLNLPATSDVAVFNAIFKSLKDNLLTEIDEE